MTWLASCDPAKENYATGDQAVAHFCFGAFIGVGFYNPLDYQAVVDVFVCEKMRVYPGPKKEDPNDLIEVAEGCGAIILRAKLNKPGVQVVRYTAQEWKGAIKKPLHHRRIWEALRPEERLTFASCAGKTVSEIDEKLERCCKLLAKTGEVREYSWEVADLFDAVGIGMFHLKRITKGGLRRT